MSIFSKQVPSWVPTPRCASARVSPTQFIDIDRRPNKTWTGQLCHTQVVAQIGRGVNWQKVGPRLYPEFEFTVFRRSLIESLHVAVGPQVGIAVLHGKLVAVYSVPEELILQMSGVDETKLACRCSVLAWNAEFDVLGQRGFGEHVEITPHGTLIRIAARPGSAHVSIHQWEPG